MPSLSFEKGNMAKVLRGEKTQTRRTWPKQRVKVGDVCQLRQGRYKWLPQHVVITDVRRELLGDMTEADARAEGCKSLAEFQQVWNMIYSSKNIPWTAEQDSWVIDFCLVQKDFPPGAYVYPLRRVSGNFTLEVPDAE